MQKLFRLYVVLILITIGCSKNDREFNDLSVIPRIVVVDLSVPADSIHLDPYGYAPLSAQINFPSAVEGKTFISVKGKHGAATDIEHVFNDNGLSHSVQVIGLYADYLNTVNIRLISSAGDTVAKATVNIQTASLPPNLPTSIVADIFPNNNVAKGLNLISSYSSNPHIPLLVDNYGDIRWLLNYTLHPQLNKLRFEDGIKRLKNGNFYFGDKVSNQICEVDLLGKILHIWDLTTTGYIFHHDIEEKPDGNFIASVDKTGSTHPNGVETIEDYIIEIDRKTGGINTVWDLKVSLDEYRTALTTDANDWMHVNSVLYDSTDNTIIISGRTQGVVKLTFDNKVKWIISPHRGWGTNQRGEDLKQFLLTPLAADGTPITDTAILDGAVNHTDFEWCWFQHSTIFLPNGNYMLFDNGSSRNYDPLAPKYSRAVEYKIDPVNMTIQQKWQYGKERGLETFSSIVSGVQFLPGSNHVLFCPGFRVMNYKGLGGKVVEVDYNTKQVVSQLSFSAANGWGFHRAHRISAYPF